jgi:alpha-amylase
MKRFRATVISFVALWSCLTACGPATKGPDSELKSRRQTAQNLGFLADLPPQKPTDVVVQLFNWPFDRITNEMPLLARMGYAQIHVSPPNLTIDSDQWWGRYQPVDYRKIEGPLGDEAAFKRMIDAAKRNGIRIIVDIVFNHTANERSPLPASAEVLNRTLGPLFSAQDYQPAFCISDYNDVYQVRKGRLCGGAGDSGLPDLDQNSPRVLQVQQDFLRYLVGLGVDGFRLDAVKHMEPSYFSQLLRKDIVGDRFIFGEIIADNATFDRDISPYLQAYPMSLYDFPLRSTIQRAFSFGANLSELVSPDLVNQRKALAWDRAVTFVINHDIPNNDGFRFMIMDPTDEKLAYAFILGRSEGVPYVYSDLGTRGGAGLRDDRWAFAHRSADLARMIYFHNHVHGTLSKVLYADACRILVARDGKGIFGINKCLEPFQGQFSDERFQAGNYRELRSGANVRAEGSSLSISLPPRSYTLLVRL